MTTPIEREHKWLLRSTPWSSYGIELVPEHGTPCSTKTIVQVYLNGTSLDLRRTDRIRMTKGEDGECQYFHTQKSHKGEGEAYESEEEITNTEFSRLYRTFRSPFLNEIVKTRRTFTHNGLKWELDEFHSIHVGPSGYANSLLEVEVDDISFVPEVPAHWRAQRVTGDPRYSNAYMALTDIGRLLWEDARK